MTRLRESGPQWTCTSLVSIWVLATRFITGVAAIDCFECFSRNASIKACEDEFGPHNETGHLIHKNCRVGLLQFQAFYCVKIKGINKETGQRVLMRTCSTTDWGSTCGLILIDQGIHANKEEISGCLSSCNYDGCNVAQPQTLSLSPTVLITLTMLSFAISWQYL